MSRSNPVDEFGDLSVKSFNLLLRNGLRTQREVACMTDAEILALRGCGPKSLADIRAVVGYRQPNAWDRRRRRAKERKQERAYEAWVRDYQANGGVRLW